MTDLGKPSSTRLKPGLRCSLNREKKMPWYDRANDRWVYSPEELRAAEQRNEARRRTTNQNDQRNSGWAFWRSWGIRLDYIMVLIVILVVVASGISCVADKVVKPLQPLQSTTPAAPQR